MNDNFPDAGIHFTKGFEKSLEIFYRDGSEIAKSYILSLEAIAAGIDVRAENKAALEFVKNELIAFGKFNSAQITDSESFNYHLIISLFRLIDNVHKFITTLSLCPN